MDPLSIVCPTCSAAAGARCKNYKGQGCAPHGDRARLVRRLAAREQAKVPCGRFRCRRCGHRAVEPERHNAIMAVECPGGADEFEELAA